MALALRSAKYEVANMSPNFVMFRREIRVSGYETSQPDSGLNPLDKSEAFKKVSNTMAKT